MASAYDLADASHYWQEIFAKMKRFLNAISSTFISPRMLNSLVISIVYHLVR